MSSAKQPLTLVRCIDTACNGEFWVPEKREKSLCKTSTNPRHLRHLPRPERSAFSRPFLSLFPSTENLAFSCDERRGKMVIKVYCTLFGTGKGCDGTFTPHLCTGKGRLLPWHAFLSRKSRPKRDGKTTGKRSEWLMFYTHFSHTFLVLKIRHCTLCKIAINTKIFVWLHNDGPQIPKGSNNAKHDLIWCAAVIRSSTLISLILSHCLSQEIWWLTSNLIYGIIWDINCHPFLPFPRSLIINHHHLCALSCFQHEIWTYYNSSSTVTILMVLCSIRTLFCNITRQKSL